jgi:hypothetical protein
VALPLRSDEPEPDRRLHARRQLATVAEVMERLPHFSNARIASPNDGLDLIQIVYTRAL